MTGPLFKWFGSKWQASKYYPEPRCERVFEPYAGGAGYSLRHASKRVTLWESNTNLLALWYWLTREATEQAIREIPCHLPEGTDIRTLGLTAGQALLLKHWQRTNNVGECWTVSPWGNLPGQWTENTRARVASEVGEVSHWQIRPIAYNEIGTYFVDPPYLFNYQYGSPPVDYAALAAQVRGIPAGSQAIVCEARCPKTDKIPDWLPFEDFRRTVTSRRKQGEHTHSREVMCLI